MSEVVEESPKPKRGRKKKAASSIDTPIPGNPNPPASKKTKAPATWTEAFLCRLTPEEMETKAAAMTAALDEIEELEAEKKSRTADIKGKIDGKKSELRDLRKARRLGQEEREVEVYESFVFATNTVEIRRADTDELVRTRAMRADERQEELPLASDNAQGNTPLPTWATETEEYTGRKVDAEEAPTSDDGTSIDDPQSVLDAEGFAGDEDEGL